MFSATNDSASGQPDARISSAARSTSNGVRRNSTSSETSAQNAATSSSAGQPIEPALTQRSRLNCMCVWPATTSRLSTPSSASSNRSGGDTSVRIGRMSSFGEAWQ